MVLIRHSYVMRRLCLLSIQLQSNAIIALALVCFFPDFQLRKFLPRRTEARLACCATFVSVQLVKRICCHWGQISHIFAKQVVVFVIHPFFRIIKIGRQIRKVIIDIITWLTKYQKNLAPGKKRSQQTPLPKKKRYPNKPGPNKKQLPNKNHYPKKTVPKQKQSKKTCYQKYPGCIPLAAINLSMGQRRNPRFMFLYVSLRQRST